MLPSSFFLQTRHATRDAQRSADGGEDGDECLYHQFPYIQFLVSFHNEIRVLVVFSLLPFLSSFIPKDFLLCRHLRRLSFLRPI